MGPAKVIVIGLDAADRHLVERWCDSGDLPTLRRLREAGVHGTLSTPVGVADDSVWSSFATAVPPGRHGRFSWQAVEPGTYATPMSRDRPPPVPPFWVALSEAGRRVAVLDVPKNPLTPGLHGIQLTDWHVHGRDHLETRSDPPELAASVLERFGDDATDRPDRADYPCAADALAAAHVPAFRHHLLHGIEQKTRLATDLLGQGPWDLFLVVFKEAHCVGHQCWPMVGGDDDPVLAVYQALDRAIGELVRCAGPDAHVVVFSDIGMSSNETGEHFLDQVLRRLEPRVISRRQRVRRRFRFPHGDERARRLVYPLGHNEISGAIRFNLIGREPAGLVRRGAEEDGLRRRITEELLALRDPDTAEPVVETVVDTHTAFPGSETSRLPDLFAVWARGGPFVGASSAGVELVRAGPHGFRPGNHVSGGFLVVAGPAVVPDATPIEAALVDVAPTVARMLDVDLPGCDGRPIPGLLRA